MQEAKKNGIPLAEIMDTLSEDQTAALCRGEELATEGGTIFPLLANIPGDDVPMVAAILARMTQAKLDDWHAKRESFESDMEELLKTIVRGTPNAMPAIRKFMESYGKYRDANTNVMETIFNDYFTLLRGLGQLPKLTIHAERGAAAARKHENSPAAKAKAAAIKLWPEANRKGWTAEQFHTRIINQGHTVKFDTVRKWMTKLRSNGTC